MCGNRIKVRVTSNPDSINVEKQRHRDPLSTITTDIHLSSIITIELVKRKKKPTAVFRSLSEENIDSSFRTTNPATQSEEIDKRTDPSAYGDRLFSSFFPDQSFRLTLIVIVVMVNWTFHHDDYAPFGSQEQIDRSEFYSLLITSIFFLIGFLGNVIMFITNIYILRHSYHGEKRTLENFLLEISCFDALVLVYHLINAIIRYQSNAEHSNETLTGFINISAVCCKLLTYLIRISTLMSHWLIVLLLLNRIILVHSKCHRFVAIINAKYAV